MIAINTRAPLYMTPPCSSRQIESAMRAAEVGMISTPKQGNRMVAGAWWCYDNGVFGGKYPGHAAAAPAPRRAPRPAPADVQLDLFAA